jgi:tRNA 2-thiouridine synthesizing protein A
MIDYRGEEPVTSSQNAPSAAPREVGFHHALRDGTPMPDRVLDAPGMTCISLTPLIASTMAELAPSALLEVRTDDPAAREGVPAWCRLTRHRLIHTSLGTEAGPTADQTVFHIVKRENQP